MTKTHQAAERRKEQLLALREKLIQRVGLLEDAIHETITPPGEISTVRTHNADSDSEGLDEDVAVARNEQALLEAVESALARMESGNYGLCQNCHQRISAERLDALPFTAFCVSCAALEERGQAIE